MRPGKLFKLRDATHFYKMEFDETPPIKLLPGTVFMVISVKPEQRLVNYHDIWSAWQVLVEDKIGLIEINQVTLEDITPF